VINFTIKTKNIRSFNLRWLSRFYHRTKFPYWCLYVFYSVLPGKCRSGLWNGSSLFRNQIQKHGPISHDVKTDFEVHNAPLINK